MIRTLAGIILSVAIMLTCISPTEALSCEEDSLSDVSGSGAILEMLSGQIYKIAEIDRIDSTLWLVADDVLICAQPSTNSYQIINKDEDGEEVHATRLQ